MRKILIVLIDLFFVLSSIAVFSFAFDDFHISLILLASVFLLGSIAVSYLLIKEIVLGEKTYDYSDSKLYMYQKGKLKYAFNKNTIEDIILIFDFFNDSLYMISFVFEGKKHYISLNKQNESHVNRFIEGINSTKKNNLWYYVLLLFVSWLLK